MLKCNSIADDETDRDAVRRQRGRDADRPARARHLLPPRRRAGTVRDHPGAQRARPLPRTQPHLPVRSRQRRPRRASGDSDIRCGLPDRLGRPDAAQPEPSRRGAGADRAPAPHRRGSTRRSSSRSPTTWSPGSCSPTTPGNGSARRIRSSRTARSGCTAGPSTATRRPFLSRSARQSLPDRCPLFTSRSPAEGIGSPGVSTVPADADERRRHVNTT